MQFPTKGATGVKHLHYEFFYEYTNLTMAKAYSVGLSEIPLWQLSLECVRKVN